MNASDALQYLAWLLYLAIFVRVTARAFRRPTNAHVNEALFFGASALAVVLSLSVVVLQESTGEWLARLTGPLAMALPYLQLRLVGDFRGVPAWLMRAAELGLIASTVALLTLPMPLSPVATAALLLYFVAVLLFDILAFGREARRTVGVTQRRMQAVSLGSCFLAADIVAVGLASAFPGLADVWTDISSMCGVASGLSYFAGFAPPIWVRRAWQEPELRALLGRAVELPRIADMAEMARELERASAAALGASGAALGLWDARAGVLRFFGTPVGISTSIPMADTGSFKLGDNVWELDPARHAFASRPFLDQRPHLSRDVQCEDPLNAALYRANNASSILSAPVTAGEQRLGVLLVYAPREPIFAESDLELIQLLADQAAVILESRQLIDQAGRMSAREQAAHLKEDFLSSAAHDLKTPLTGIIAQAQLMQRRAQRNPADPTDQVGLERIVRQGQRLKTLVLELLDGARFDTGSVVLTRTVFDLAAGAREVCDRAVSTEHRLSLDADEPVVGAFDRIRISQLLENLVDNAVKYSPYGGDILVRVWREGSCVRVSVKDQGIGVPTQDLPALFERFHRGSNVDARRFAGLGLGLYFCRQIAEQHGGRIWAESAAGRGSTFHVALPLVPAPAASADGPGEVVSHEPVSA